MPFSRREVDRFLTSQKMKMDSKEGRRHTQYILRLKDKKIPLPYLLTLSRGTGQVSQRNLKGLASDLGLSLKGIEEGIRCPMSRECVLLCLTARLLNHVIELHEKDKVTFNETWLIDSGHSVRLVLDEVPGPRSDNPGWSTQETKELQQASIRIERAEDYDVLRPVSALWKSLAAFNKS